MGENDVLEQWGVNVTIRDLVRRSICHHRSRQCEKRSPDSLRDQCRSRDVIPIRRSDFCEKQMVTGHGIVNAGSRKDEPVMPTKCGDHEGSGNPHAAGIPEAGFLGWDGSSTLRGLLNFRKRQQTEEGKVWDRYKSHN